MDYSIVCMRTWVYFLHDKSVTESQSIILKMALRILKAMALVVKVCFSRCSSRQKYNEQLNKRVSEQ